MMKLYCLLLLLSWYCSCTVSSVLSHEHHQSAAITASDTHLMEVNLHMKTLVTSLLSTTSTFKDHPSALNHILNHQPHKLLLSSAWLKFDIALSHVNDCLQQKQSLESHDASLSNVLKIKSVEHKFGAHTVYRLHIYVNDVEIEEQDRVLMVDHNHHQQSQPQQQHEDQITHAYAPSHAYMTSSSSSSSSLSKVSPLSNELKCAHVMAWTMNDYFDQAHKFQSIDEIAQSIAPQVHSRLGVELQHVSDKVLLIHDLQIKPVWKIRVPALSPLDMIDYHVDAIDGSIIRKTKSVVEALSDATAFTTDSITNLAPLTNVNLTDLVNLQAGSFLTGKFFRTENCCDKLVCLSAPGCNSIANSRCAQSSDSASNIWTPQQSFSISSSDLTSSMRTYLGPYLNLPISASGATCTGKPKAQATAQTGFTASPTEAIPDSDNDAFAEVQVYYSLTRMFNFVRSMLGNNTFCLNPPTMSCNANGEPIMNNATGLPNLAFSILTNLMLPPRLDPLIVVRPISSPVSISWSSLRRVDNAFFLRPITGTLPQFMSSLYFIRSNSILGFFQGTTLDSSYDISIIFHEFTHAIVYHFVPNLKSLSYDIYGSKADPGAMNEGWADYFSATFRDDPLLGKYFFPPFARTAVNNNTCPADIYGQVHADSTIFSGALWKIRAAVMSSFGMSGVRQFDKVVMQAMSLALPLESMNDQAQKIYSLLSSHQTLNNPTILQAATQAFVLHNINTACARVLDLTTSPTKPNKVIYINEPSSYGFSQIMPYPLQYKVVLAAGQTQGTVSWTQNDLLRSDSFGMFSGVYGSKRFVAAVVSYNCDIQWSYSVGRPSATGCRDGSSTREVISNDAQLVIPTSPQNFISSATGYQVRLQITTSSATSTTVYVSPVLVYSENDAYSGQAQNFAFEVSAASAASLARGVHWIVIGIVMIAISLFWN